jgi:hypothetical protein
MKTLTRNRAPRQRDREIAFQVLGELLALALFMSAVASLRVTRRRTILLRQRLERALQLHGWRKILGDEQVRATGLAHGGPEDRLAILSVANRGDRVRYWFSDLRGVHE